MTTEKILQTLKEKLLSLKGKPIIIPLTRGVAAGLALVLLCAVGWAYYLGLMVGRGQNPQAEFSGITGMGVPADERNVSQKELTETALPETPMTVESPAEPIEGGPSGRLPSQFAVPQGEQLAAWPEILTRDLETSAPRRQETAPRQAARPVRQAQPDKNSQARNAGSQYYFTYQVAAFRSAKDADSLKSRLNKAGIRSTTQKSGKVTLVTCSIRGRDGDALAFRQKISSLKLGQPLLISKKPVAAGGSRKK